MENELRGYMQARRLWEAVGLQSGHAQQGTGYTRGEVCPGAKVWGVIGVQETSWKLGLTETI